MQISSTSSTPLSSVTPARQPERAERGPDRDKDGDETSTASAAAKSQPTPPPGRGGNVNIVA